jgi:predicted CXXCH cytochrome family protein
MSGIHLRKHTILLLAASLALALAAVMALANVQPAQASSLTIPKTGAELQAGTEECLACHSQPGMTMTLQPSGEILSVTVDPQAYAASVHGKGGIACTACHKDITGYPHPQFTAGSLRDTAILMTDQCQDCHVDKYEQSKAGAHQAALDAGNKNAAVCSDCHNPHTQPQLTDPATGKIFPTERIKIPNTCARCHNAIYGQYSTSAHGSLLLSTGNLDVPECTECHGVHNMVSATNPEFRLNSTNLCSSCHTDAIKMAKYGLSTQVMSTYVSDFHGTTVSLFQKQSPHDVTNKPVCFDCHGVHNIARVDDPNRGLAIKENMLASCKRCHPDATANFPDSWMSHFIASPTRNSLVWYVQLFYIILIPTVLGGMAFIIATDVYRKIRERGKGANH